MSLDFFEILESVDSEHTRLRLVELFKNNYQFAKLCCILEHLSCRGVGKETLYNTLSYFNTDKLENLKGVYGMPHSKLPTDTKLVYLLTTASRGHHIKKYLLIQDIFYAANETESKWAYRIIAEPLRVRCLICPQ